MPAYVPPALRALGAQGEAGPKLPDRIWSVTLRWTRGGPFLAEHCPEHLLELEEEQPEPAVTEQAPAAAKKPAQAEVGACFDRCWAVLGPYEEQWRRRGCRCRAFVFWAFPARGRAPSVQQAQQPQAAAHQQANAAAAGSLRSHCSTLPSQSRLCTFAGGPCCPLPHRCVCVCGMHSHACADAQYMRARGRVGCGPLPAPAATALYSMPPPFNTRTALALGLAAPGRPGLCAPL